MADKASSDEPVYKITIQRESSAGGEPKFKLVPENFTLGSQAAPTVALPGDVVCSSPATTPVFSAGTYVKCAVPHCYNYFDGGRNEFMGISYFPFPQDPELRLEWIKAIDLPLDKDTNHLKVCSDHFANQDFVTDFIEVEDVSEARKPVENIELRPNAKPTVKLGGKNEKMANFAKETWDKNVKMYGDKTKVSKGKFKGLDNPLIDTANEMRSSTSQDASEPLVPVITSVGTIHPLTNCTDAGGKPQKDLNRERADKHGKVVDVVEVDDEDDFEMTAKSSARETEVTPQPDQSGLINIPAAVKLPPRRTITGEGTSAPTLLFSNVVPTTVDIFPETSQRRSRRKRRTREEMRKCEEDDEWEPTFWSKKTLEKEGFEFEPKRKTQKVNAILASATITSDEEWDEGFRIDEPTASRSQGSPVKLRPGPASRTRRPKYVKPTSENSDQSEPEDKSAEQPGDESPKNERPDLEEVLSDKSLLVDWSFFKSLVPDLARLSREKRDELKTFMLDTLNARIYEGKPIVSK